MEGWISFFPGECSVFLLMNFSCDGPGTISQMAKLPLHRRSILPPFSPFLFLQVTPIWPQSPPPIVSISDSCIPITITFSLKIGVAQPADPFLLLFLHHPNLDGQKVQRTRIEMWTKLEVKGATPLFHSPHNWWWCPDSRIMVLRMRSTFFFFNN